MEHLPTRLGIKDPPKAERRDSAHLQGSLFPPKKGLCRLLGLRAGQVLSSSPVSLGITV